MEEDKENEDSDVEREMDDDGHRPLREPVKALNSDEGLHDVDGFGGVCIHPEQHTVSRTTV